MLNSLHQRTASSYARRAQIAFVTLGVGATALAAFTLRAPVPVQTPSMTIPAPAAGKSAGDARLARGGPFDADAIARRMDQIANHPSAADTYVPDGKDKKEEEHVVQNETVKFLGAVIEPTRRVALLKIGDHQRMLGPGESDGDVSVVDVSADHVEITLKGAVSQTLTKSARSGPTVTYVSASASAPGDGGPAMPGAGRPKRGPLGRPTPMNDEAPSVPVRDGLDRLRNKPRDLTPTGEHP